MNVTLTESDQNTNTSSILATLNSTMPTNVTEPEQTIVSEEDENLLNIVVPLIVIGVLVLAATVIFFVIRRRSTRQERQQFAPVYYSVEHEESGNEWESQLMEDELNKHVNIVKPNRGNQARLMFEKGNL